MDCTKHYEYFNPTEVIDNIHIIGCGAIGSTVAENLVRLGITKIHLYDFDVVNPHNVANQMFNDKDIGLPKVLALKTILQNINPEVQVTVHPKGYTSHNVKNGHIFLCVDDIELRKRIVEEASLSNYVKSFLDFRMGLSDAQHYARANTPDEITALLETMSFTNEEARREMPVSACGTNLNILPTVRVIVGYGIANFINYIKGSKLKPMILIDAFEPSLLTI